MTTMSPGDPLTFRQDVVTRLFKLLKASESCAIASMASVGRSRLVRFVTRADVRAHYLQERADKALLALVDCHRIAEFTEWGMYELLLTSLTNAVRQTESIHSLLPDLRTWQKEVILSQNALLARRYVEEATAFICGELGFRLCFLIDEFDEAYRTLEAPALANLRALRDAYKNHLCYLLTFRDAPERLRNRSEHEEFYELFARNIIWLGPYNVMDAHNVIEQRAAREGLGLSGEQKELLITLSGGHGGLLVALVHGLAQIGEESGDLTQQLVDHASVQIECQRIWDALRDDERVSLSHLVHGRATSEQTLTLLLSKHVVTEASAGKGMIFSPIFQQYVRQQAIPMDKPLRIVHKRHEVWVEGKLIEGLTPQDFRLLSILFERINQVFTRHEILQKLYPDDVNYDVNDNLDTIVKRVRDKIEPVRKTPRYLLTVRGVGFKLVDSPG